MPIFIAVAFLLSILLVFLVHLLISKIGEQKGAVYVLPPSPKKLPVIGNLHQLGKLPHQSLWVLAQKYGPLMHLQLGCFPTLVVSSAEMAREVLKTHDLDFCSRPRLTATDKFSHNQVDLSFSPYGDYWREMRKICILELFSVKRVQSFRFVREEEVYQTVQLIFRSRSVPINLSKLMTTLANNIICRIALGNKYQEGEYEKSQFYRILQESEAMLGSFFVSDFFPSMRWIDRLAGSIGRLEKNVGELDAFYEKVIEEHLDPVRTMPEHEDIVDVLLRLQKDSSHLSKDNIMAVLMEIFVAGTETASATLVWAMAELMRKPSALEKAQGEVRAAVGSKGKVEEGDLHQLQYLKSVVKETLRLHSPVPLLFPRESRQHCQIQGYDILPNTRVYVNVWGIGRDPKTWESPEEFLPERFMDSSMDFTGHDFELLPFGSGRRSCPAMYFGILTIELALANLLYCFQWELPLGTSMEDIDMNEAPGVTIHKRSALHLLATESLHAMVY